MKRHTRTLLLVETLVKRTGLLAAILVYTGCAVGPRYSRPTVVVPSNFKESGPWKAAQPGDQESRGKWWEVFGDQQLNALQEQVGLSNQTLKMAEARFRAARALVRFARAGRYPTVQAGADITHNRISSNQANLPASASSSYTNYLLPVDLSYEVDAWGRVRRTVEGSRAAAQARAADLETVRLALHAELAVNYFALRGLDAERELLDSTVAAFRRALELTQNRHRGGVASQVDVSQAETQLQTTLAQATDISVHRAQFEHAIAVLAGEAPSTFTLLPSPQKSAPPSLPTALPSELLERRPDIAAAERRVAAANARIGIAKAAYFPSLMIGVLGGVESRDAASLFSWPSRLWSLGPTAIVTAFDGGRRRAVSDEAKAVYDETVANYRETVLSAYQEVEDNLAALRILEEEARTQEAAVAAAKRSVELATNRYKGGVVTYLEVVTNQSTALANERLAVNILERRLTATVNLVKALGGGWNISRLPTAAEISSTK